MSDAFRYEEKEVLYLDYTNWRGVRQWRKVVPLLEAPEFKTKLLDKRGEDDVRTDKEAWGIHVFDLDRGARRFYCLRDIHEIRVTPPEGYSDGNRPVGSWTVTGGVP